ncbi:MAG: hypothetical protein ISS77_02385 [Phycisphaerae bacterium]|nr:hypothetical protein [Phycisphaerae bacterium]
MELIKKIKETEAKAQQMVTDAKSSVVSDEEKFQQQKRQSLEQAQQQRRDAIEQAVAQAKQQAQADVEKLKADAKSQREDLRNAASSKIDNAVEKIVNYIKG